MTRHSSLLRLDPDENPSRSYVTNFWVGTLDGRPRTPSQRPRKNGPPRWMWLGLSRSGACGQHARGCVDSDRAQEGTAGVVEVFDLLRMLAYDDARLFKT